MRKKALFVVCLLGAVICGVVAFGIFQTQETTLKHARVYYTEEFRDIENPSIIAVGDYDDATDYMLYMLEQSDYLGFDFTAIPEGEELYLIGFDKHTGLANVVIKNPLPIIADGPDYPYWIWYKFLSKNPPQGER